MPQKNSTGNWLLCPIQYFLPINFKSSFLISLPICLLFTFAFFDFPVRFKHLNHLVRFRHTNFYFSKSNDNLVYNVYCTGLFEKEQKRKWGYSYPVMKERFHFTSQLTRRSVCKQSKLLREITYR